MWRRRGAEAAGLGRGLGGVPPLPQRLPAAGRQARRHAAAVGELPGLRHRVRHRRARARGREGRLPGDLQLVGLRPGPVRLVVQHRELRLGPRRCVRIALERQLGRRWRRRLVRRRRRRRLVAAPMAEEEHRALQAAAVAGRRRRAAPPAGGRRGGRRAVPARSPSSATASRGRPRRPAATAGSSACSRRPSCAAMRSRRGRLRARGARRSGPSRRRPPMRWRSPASPPATTRPGRPRPSRWPPAARPSSGRPRRWRALARRDEPAYAAALRAVIADFEARDLHLTGVAIADTALVLERLAEPRGLAQRPVLAAPADATSRSRAASWPRCAAAPSSPRRSSRASTSCAR